MIVHEPEFTRLAERVATAIKYDQLRHTMDGEALALNVTPTTEETQRVKRVLRLVEQAGYEIHKKG